jgi:hypothetical protein
MQVHGDDGGAVHFDAAAQQGAERAGLDRGRAGPGATSWPKPCATSPRLKVQAPVNAALTVVCEGPRQRHAAEFGVDFEVTPYGQHAIATRLDL